VKINNEVSMSHYKSYINIYRKIASSSKNAGTSSHKSMRSKVLVISLDIIQHQ